MSLYSSLTQVLAPFAAKIKGIQTGYDGTEYDSPGEAVREQINDLHVLIGHVPGRAIDASAVAYGDSDVGTELTNVNGRLGDLSNLSTTAKNNLVAAINEAASTGGGGGQPIPVTLASQMDTEQEDALYLYIGNEEGYEYGYIYAYQNGAFAPTTLYGRGQNGADGVDGADGQDGVDGADGQDGQDGQDGFSPTATVEATSTGVRISITDKNGTTSATVQNGTATDAQVAAWLDNHPEATTTVEDGSISKAKLAADVLEPVSEIPYIEKTIGEQYVAAQQAFSNVTWKGGYFNPTTGAVAGDSRYKYTDEYFDIGILAAVKSVYLNTANIACVVFYDASKEVVGTINQTTNGGLIVTSITPPENAVYFRICQPTANTNPFPLSPYEVSDLFAKAETDLPVDIESVLTAQGGIQVNGNLSTYPTWKVTDFIKVSPGMLLKYSGCGNIGNNTLCPIAFYDSDKKPVLAIRPDESNFVYMYNKGWLDASASGMSINFGFVLVPVSAHYCRVSGYNLLRPTLEVAKVEPWAGKKCVFFGDSITAGTNTAEKYCNFIAMLRGITVANYGVGGNNLVEHGMSRVTAFVTDYADNPADAFIFAYGTNDWYANKPLGEWYTTDDNGVRTLTTDTTTFRGAWVQILTYLKTNFDGKKIILMTPIHRGAGSYTSDLTRNTIGLYLEDYVNVIKEAGEIFSVDVIDLYSESGLTPDINPNTAYFTGNDRLHPNAEGHKQMAKTISAKMGKMTI